MIMTLPTWKNHANRLVWTGNVKDTQEICNEATMVVLLHLLCLLDLLYITAWPKKHPLTDRLVM
jgi:hypothetical protein